MGKRARLADFELRVGDGPTDVHTLGEHGRFVTVNPMSDEHALLQRLEWDPRSCIKLDLNWEHAGDVAFVEIQSTEYTSRRPTGVYVRKAHFEAPPTGYNESLDDIRSILGDLCLALEQEGELTISGFGQDRWPVDVGTDLLVLLEQLPALLRSLAGGRPAMLEFYEQGIQRNLVFTPAGDDYEVECESYADWQPDPRIERVRQGDLLSMLQTVQDNFMEVVRNNTPELTNHPWVLSWLRGQ